MSVSEKYSVFPPSGWHTHVFLLIKLAVFGAHWQDAWVPKIRQYLLFAACAFNAFAFLIFPTPLDMEDAIKTLVTTFIKSSKGKDNLDSKGFQKLVSKHLGGMMEVRNSIFALYNSRVCWYNNFFLIYIYKKNRSIFLTMSERHYLLFASVYHRTQTTVPQ